MKNATKFIITILLAVMCGLSYAQTNEPDYKKPPKRNEKVLGTISVETYEKECHNSYECPTEQDAYVKLLEQAKKEYSNKAVEIRDMKTEAKYRNWVRIKNQDWTGYCKLSAVGKVVYTLDPSSQFKETISPAIEKAFRNVREGSRMAINQVTVTNGINKEETKDQLIDILLDKGYKVVAKEYLEKLYEEQQAQQSGIYNDKTTVQDNNFSAVGYFINVKVTETSLRVQVINVSTGEYEGNATVNF